MGWTSATRRARPAISTPRLARGLRPWLSRRPRSDGSTTTAAARRPGAATSRSSRPHDPASVLGQAKGAGPRPPFAERLAVDGEHETTRGESVEASCDDQVASRLGSQRYGLGAGPGAAVVGNRAVLGDAHGASDHLAAV